MLQICKLNKDVDLGYTIPDLHIDIDEAITTGVLKNTPNSSSTYNMLNDTDEVGPVVRDVFTALDHSRILDAQFSSMTPTTDPSTSV